MWDYVRLRLFLLLSVAWVSPLIGQVVSTEEVESPAQISENRLKIEAAIQSYVSAFNERDVDKLVSHWSPDGVYVSRTSGEQLTGKESLQEEFSAILSSENAPTLAVETESIEFVSPNVALQRGAAVISRKESSEDTDYQVVYVEHDGKWLIDRVTEDVIEPVVSNYEQLKGLEFLIGEWINEGDGMTVELDVQWTRNQNYLSGKFQVSMDGEEQSSGLEIIGWDAKNKQIRGWLFDSDGGFVQNTWREREGEWVIQSVATLADGASGSSTSVIRSSGDDTCGWRKFNRVIDGQLLPNTEEVTLRRR